MTFGKLSQFVLYLRWMQEQDLDVLCLPSSFKGFGKSSFCIQVVRRYIELFGLVCQKCKHEFVFTGVALINDVYGKLQAKEGLSEACPKCGCVDVGRPSRLNFMTYLAYDNDDIKRMVYDIAPFSPIIGDEAVRFLMAEDWNSWESKELKKLFAQMRTKHLLVFANIPRFGWVDRKYRNDMATFWVRILKRGLAILLQPDLGETDDAWHLKEFQQLLGSYFFFTSHEDLVKKAEKIVAKHPCAFDWFMIPPVPKEIYDEYLKVRNKKIFEKRQSEDIVDQKELGKICAYNLFNKWGEVVGAVKSSRFDRPTFRIMEDFVFCHPQSGERLVSYTTIRNWVKEVKRLVDKPYSK